MGGPDHQGGGEGRQDSREGGREGRPGSGAGGGEGRQGHRAGGGEGRQGHLRVCVWQKVAAPPRPPRLAKVLTIYSPHASSPAPTASRSRTSEASLPDAFQANE